MKNLKNHKKSFAIAFALTLIVVATGAKAITTPIKPLNDGGWAVVTPNSNDGGWA